MVPLDLLGHKVQLEIVVRKVLQGQLEPKGQQEAQASKESR